MSILVLGRTSGERLLWNVRCPIESVSSMHRIKPDVKMPSITQDYPWKHFTHLIRSGLPISTAVFAT
ncbi:MAG: hypothetical protein QXN83_06610, partial [Nitrososphaerales archaeon]